MLAWAAKGYPGTPVGTLGEFAGWCKGHSDGEPCAIVWRADIRMECHWPPKFVSGLEAEEEAALRLGAKPEGPAWSKRRSACNLVGK